MIKHNISIKLPDSVPPAVSNSFAALIPTLAVILLFWGIRYGLKFDVNTTITYLIAPLKSVLVGNNLFGGFINSILNRVFWSFGIHGPAILGPIIRPMWIQQFLKIWKYSRLQEMHQLPNLFTEQFIQWFVWIGGSGSTLALVIMFMFSKSKFLKELGRLSFVPGLFNINEPIIFGAPIVMNPILIIPFVITPLVTTTVSYFAVVSGMIPLMMAKLPFTMLAPIAAVISTDWTIMAGVLVLVNFVISFVIYYPFFKMYEKQQLAGEEKTECSEQLSS